jgi:hypothetical protein
MDAFEPAPPPHQTRRHPVARWRHIASSPVYRLGTTDGSRRNVAAGLCLATVLGLWFGPAALGLKIADGPAATGVLLYFLMWAFLAAAACMAGTTAFLPEERDGTMEQLVLTPLDSYVIVRDRAFAAAEPLAPAALAALALSVHGPVEMALSHHRGAWLYGLIWLLVTVNLFASLYLGLALGMLMAFMVDLRAIALFLAIGALTLIEAGAAYGVQAFPPVAVMTPFARVILAGLVLARCESLFNRLRLPGEQPDEAAEPPPDYEEDAPTPDDPHRAVGHEERAPDAEPHP